MYGKGLGVVNAATGVSLLPDTGSNHTLFVIAISLMASGVVVFAGSTLLGLRNRRSETN